MKNIVIFGSSGHCKVIIDIIEKLNKYNLVGIIDKYKEKDEVFFNHKIIGSDDNINILIKKYNIECGVVGIGDNSVRKKVIENLIRISSNLKFETLLHPKSNIGRNVEVGDGTVVMSGVSINSDTKIGRHCIVNTNSSLDHDCFMGNYVSVSPNCGIGGNVKIGNNTFIGIGSNIFNDITIGKNSIIGASSLVVKDIDNSSFGYGVPFKKLN